MVQIVQFLEGFGGACLIWLIVKLFHPYHCSNKYCGFFTWSANRMFHHIEGKHAHQE